MRVQKEAKHARGNPETPRTGTPARNGCAVPKRGLNGAYRVSATHFYRLPRWSAEWRTTTPVPSSKEGNYGGSGTAKCQADIRKKPGRSRTFFINGKAPFPPSRSVGVTGITMKITVHGYTIGA